jgi:hypothetical protein
MLSLKGERQNDRWRLNQMELNIRNDSDRIQNVPIQCKMTLTIREAAEYSNIGINKIDSLLKMPNCPFVLYIGTRKLVKRVEFEQYIRGKFAI